jgi:hypothetical protein
MTDQELADLIAVVKTHTDKLSMVDQVLKKNRLGTTVRLAYRCGSSGLYFPDDYIKEWGKKYGIGLGPDPVSETLQSDYDVPPPSITPDTMEFTTIMHPIYVCKSQIDLHMVTDEEFAENSAVLDLDDPKYRVRAPILRALQLSNPKSRLRNMAAAWDLAGKR